MACNQLILPKVTYIQSRESECVPHPLIDLDRSLHTSLVNRLLQLLVTACMLLFTHHGYAMKDVRKVNIHLVYYSV